MKSSILITGASGYLGGTLLANWKAANLTNLYEKVYALVRSLEQEEAVKQYGATPIKLDIHDEDAVAETLIRNRINVVGFMIGVTDTKAHTAFLKALKKVQKDTGLDGHFIYTSGAKLYSDMAGVPPEGELADNDPSLFEKHVAQKPRHGFLHAVVQADIKVVEMAHEYGVKSYVFVPCIVYGRGEGFGNKLSIQVVDVVEAAVAAGRVFSLCSDKNIWPVCHVKDNTGLYQHLLRQILEGKNPDSGKQGYYLASPGAISWNDLYAAMATALKRRGKIAESVVHPADDAALKAASEALNLPPEAVEFKIAGHCTFTPKHGREIGWVPQYHAEHILEAADSEVELILSEVRTHRIAV